MSVTTQRFHKRYLLVTAIVVGSFGPVFSLATTESGGDLARWTLDLLNGPGGDAVNFDADTTRFLSALTGGFLLGWGVMIFGLRAWVYDAAPEGVRKAVVAGLLAWFVLDSAGSVASGNAWNVAFNVLVLVLAVGPMWRPAVAP
ncbi:MAG: hypothetical protein R2707_09045 [Acidimicrobiales bacterium]